jgi:plastocyanin
MRPNVLESCDRVTGYIDFMDPTKAILVLLLAFVPVVHGGAIAEGKVNLSAVPKFQGPPPNARLKQKYTIGPTEAPTAIVYLEGAFQASTNKKAKVEQRQYQFVPLLLAIEKGTAVDFPNEDDAYHNVFSLSKKKRFDLGRYKKGEKSPTLTFDQPGVIRLYCEIFEHMRGTILVLDTPHFSRTDNDGNYRLENLPAGSYKLKAWLGERIVWERPVILKDGETLKVDFQEE